MDGGILRQDGAVVLHRNMPASPDALLKALAPSRDHLVVAVECLFPWDGLADLWAHAGLPCVLGPALSLQALHGGQAQNEKLDSQNMAVLRRGGRLPQASVSPAAMRATRDLLWRRWPLTRQRAELLAHLPQTHRPSNLPEIGKPLASQAHRDGVAARFPAPAVPQRGAVDLARMDDSARRLHAVALPLVQTAKPPQAPTRSRRPSVPGLGKSVRLVLRDAMHASTRCPRVQDVVASGRLVQGAQASAGTREGTAGAQIGPADLTWACSEAAVLCLRTHPAGQNYLAPLEHHHGTGNACTV